MTFDASALINATMTQANATKVELAPVGDYIGMVKDLKIQTGTHTKGDKAGETWVRLELFTESEDPKLQAIGMKSKRFRIDTLLDLDLNGQLDTGKNKNIGLGRIREAVGLNADGMPFYLGMLKGQALKFTVQHDPDPKDATKVYERCTGIRSMSAA